MSEKKQSVNVVLMAEPFRHGAMSYTSRKPAGSACDRQPLVGALFAGTPDLIYRRPNGERVVVDLKATTSRSYDHYAQLGAYALLWGELYPDRPVHSGLILRLDPNTGAAVEHRLSPERLVRASAVFTGLHIAWTNREALKATEPRRGRAA